MLQLWSACSASCDTGIRHRSRETLLEGAACADTQETSTCNVDTCPVDCVVTSWRSWEICAACEAEASNGFIRSRAITMASSDGGASCPHLSQLSASVQPSATPTLGITQSATSEPSLQPTLSPSELPSGMPTGFPSDLPTEVPTVFPTLLPTTDPSAPPTALSTASPTLQPSYEPTTDPTKVPSSVPTPVPLTPPSTVRPSLLPTEGPTSLVPTLVPTISEAALDGAVPTKIVLDVGVDEFALVAQAVIVPTLASFYSVAAERFQIQNAGAAGAAIDLLILSADGGTSAAALADSIAADVASGRLTFYWSAAHATSSAQAADMVPTASGASFGSIAPALPSVASALPGGSPSLSLSSSEPGTSSAQAAVGGIEPAVASTVGDGSSPPRDAKRISVVSVSVASSSPTPAPSDVPLVAGQTGVPTFRRTARPTQRRTGFPTLVPTGSPTRASTPAPSFHPSQVPTLAPSTQPQLDSNERAVFL